MSIKGRITLWYTAFMVAMLAAVLVFTFSVGELKTKSRVQNALMGVVEDAAHELSVRDGQPDIDDVDFFEEGVSVSLYSASGAPLFGRTPVGFASDTVLSTEGVRALGTASSVWYVYDAVQRLPGYGEIWVRGVASLSASDATIGTLLRLALIALPFMVVISAAGGYIITRRALAPVRSITQTAQDIGEKGDLTRRIGLSPGQDELHALGAAFDGMFDRLQAAFEKEKQFTLDASHELRTPTAVIMAQSEYALSNPEESPAALLAIHAQARRMSALISQLLMLARADAGKGAPDMEPLDFSELSEMVVLEQQGRPDLEGKRILPRLEEHIRLLGDQTLLMRMLINLIDNALRYGKPGGHVWVELSRDGRTAILRVRDDGPGIPPEALPHIWERFYRADPARTGDGSGLGLSMVKWIAEAHGGSASVQSALGEGSEFKIILPLS